MKPRIPRGLVLGFQPASQGFGWVAFESPLSLYDWGLSHVKRRKNAGSLRRLEKLLNRLEPQTIVLEAYEPGVASRSERVVALCNAVVALAMTRRIDVVVYSRGQIRSCFASVAARSRQEVAEAVVRSFDGLRPLLPKPRAAWDGPDRRMALFDAAAAVMTHYQLDAAHLLDEMRGEGE